MQDEKPQLQLEHSGHWVCLGCGQSFGQKYGRAIPQWKDHLVYPDS
jgi:hypothetical protein